MNTKTLLKTVRKIEIRTKLLVDSLMTGAYHSIFKGRGIEFSEVREYSPGDDVRTIDWNVTARMNQPYVKEFIEERDLTVHILIDMSASSDFGSEKSKKESALELAASIMFAAMHNNDKVGLGIFTDTVEQYFPPRKGKRHVLKLIRNLVEFKPKSKKTNLSASLRYMSKVMKRKCVVFIISDFFSDDYEKSLKLLKNKHDVIAVNISDLREHELPDVGFIELEDEETGEQILVDTSDPTFRKKHSELMDQHFTGLHKRLKKLKIDLIQLKSDESFEIPLKRFFHMRIKRVV